MGSTETSQHEGFAFGFPSNQPERGFPKTSTHVKCHAYGLFAGSQLNRSRADHKRKTRKQGSLCFAFPFISLSFASSESVLDAANAWTYFSPTTRNIPQVNISPKSVVVNEHSDHSGHIPQTSIPLFKA